MATLIDTSLWIDFTRPRSPQPLKQFIAPYILHPAAHLAEPIAFEVLRHATPQEAKLLTLQFETFAAFPTPPDLWTTATSLGQTCRKNGVNAGSLDLVIAAVVITHDATLITFDSDFFNISKACGFRAKVLQRPA